MDDVENKNVEVKVKIEPEEDGSYGEMIHENISTYSIKQECKQEIDWNSVKDEYLSYDENLETWPKLEVTFTIPQDERIFQCPECPVKTKYASNLTKHILSMHPKNIHIENNSHRSSHGDLPHATGHDTNNLSLIAQNKKKLFQSKINVYGLEYDEKKCLNHKQALIKRKYVFSCSHCPFNCNSKYDFILHTYQFHFDNSRSNSRSNSKTPSKCSHCGKSFDGNQNLKKHLPYCTNKKSFQCDYCLNYYARKYSLRSHILNMHFEGGTFKKDEQNQNRYVLPACPNCDKRYKHWQTLSNHVAYCGKKIEKLPFQCESCSYETTNKYTLAAHILQRHLKKSNLCQNLSY